MNQKQFLDKIKEQVLAEDKNAEVILFGSRARGDYREDSDWDILVLTTSTDYSIEKKIRDRIYQVQLEFLQPVSTLIVEKQRWYGMQVTPLYKNVVTEGQTV